MLNNIFKLMALFGLSTLPANLLVLNKTELLIFWQGLNADLQDTLTNQPEHQPAQSPFQFRVVNSTENQQRLAIKPALKSDEANQHAEQEISCLSLER